jgi:aubergine-like protein
LSSDAGPVIKRGTAGKAIPCTANYLQLEVRTGGGVFEYEVKFQPQVDSINEKRRCLDQHKEMLGNARNFDGTKLHLPRRLSEEVGLSKYGSSLLRD